jgi:lipoprotein-anchoring transpeptidase ErfK/SrfK
MIRIMKTETLWVIGLLFWCLFGLFSCQARGEEPSFQIPTPKIVISVKDQKLALINEGHVSHIYPVSTSRYGIGDSPGSYATPLGRLVIRKKIGKGCQLGTVFKTRVPTGEVLPPNTPGRDPIVTRILWLDGQEPQNRHAYARCIYIHGTPQEKLLGRPVSYGCIRMRSKDVATLADALPVGTTVKITPDHLPYKNLFLQELLASRL